MSSSSDSQAQQTDYVGKRIVDNKSEADVHDPNVVEKSSLPSGTRVLKPDSMYTMDYNENRLNLHVDEEGKVVKQRMG